MKKTVKEIIALAKDLNPNAYSDDVLAMWLTEAEQMILSEIHTLAPCDIPTYVPYDEHEDDVLTLGMGDDKIYLAYLQAMIDFSNKEYASYNNDIALFNEYTDTYAKWYLRTHEKGAPLISGMYLSAYGIAVSHGFSGTEEDWLASLKGERGEVGHGLMIKGLLENEAALEEIKSPSEGDVYQIKGEDAKLYLFDGESWVFIGTYRGEKGEKGDKGERGEKGEKGTDGADGTMLKYIGDGAFTGSVIGGGASAANEVTESYATVFGKECKAAHGAFAAGYSNQSTGTFSAAFGTGNLSEGWGALTAGQNNNTKGVVSTTFGQANKSDGNINFTSGSGNNITGSGNNVFGQANLSQGSQNTLIGRCINTYTDNNVALGININGAKSGTGGTIAIGKDNYVQADGASAIGQGLVVAEKNQLVLGRHNTPVPGAVVIGIGTGSADEERKNGLVIDKNGNARFLGEVTDGFGNKLSDKGTFSGDKIENAEGFCLTTREGGASQGASVELQKSSNGALKLSAYALSLADDYNDHIAYLYESPTDLAATAELAESYGASSVVSLIRATESSFNERIKALESEIALLKTGGVE